MKKETAQAVVRPATFGQLKEILSLLAQGVPNGLTFESATDVLSRKGEIISQIGNIFPRQSDLGDSVIKDWERFYQKVFGLTVDFSGVRIPAKRAGFDRLLLIPKGVSLNLVYDVVNQKHFPCWRYTNDLDLAISKNDRDPNKDGSYAIWIRGGEEADEELRNLSADDLASRQIKTVTLLEQRIFELKYFLETGRHLDQKTVTLCGGSR
ncbi:MAG: hypothetical protein WC027_03180, partial [Candidatus Paceibacterota bacterium]